ncbi:MAG: TldD/PmbA family protein [Rikenellaceae bacterium]|nr:TldD/PmbA family protein [Rikenellaceae bacterium]
MFKEEKTLCHTALQTALKVGAQKARINFVKSSMDLVNTLDGEVDKLTRCLDSSMNIILFVDGKFGGFSTNKLSENALESFILRAVDTVRMLAPDDARDLPARERQIQGSLNGRELGLYDNYYEKICADERRDLALNAAVWPSKGKAWKLISEEGEYSDSLDFSYVIDSGGLEALHCETRFSYGVEITIEDFKGRKYSGYWWDSSPFLSELKSAGIGGKALEMAIGQIGAKSIKSGKYNMVVDREVSSKLFSPILAALNGYSIQQGNSFLMDAVGKKVFSEGLTVMDCPHIKGQNGSRLFDSEGVATREHAIIEKGVVKEFFLNSYTANKLGLSPTQEDAIRPKLMPYAPDSKKTLNTLGRDDLMHLCGKGILVNYFNGGNSNTATGDFSYGIEGFYFEDGKPVKPVSGMLVTGNFLTLWLDLLAVAADARPCREKLIPSLAFKDVDFSG